MGGYDDLYKISISDNKQLSLHDGLSNLATGLGGSKDKSMSNVWSHSGKNADHVSLSARYREDWLSQKVIKILPQDMTRKWRTFPDEQGKEADEDFDIARKYRMAHQWARLYGTSFLVLDVDDKRTTEKPINWANLKPGCLKSVQVVDRTRIVATGDINYEPMSPDYGMPTTYQFVNSPTPIHASRLIRFEGTELPVYERLRNLWYSDSVLIPLMPQIDNFHTTSMAAAQMVQEANVDVISVEGLRAMLQNDKTTNELINRFSDWKMIKSVFGVSILDSTEEWEQKTVQLGGVKDLIWEYLKMVAASIGIPATRFLSASPDGMNATGESDLINYIELLQGQQKEIYEPRLKITDRLLAAHYGLDIKAMKYDWGDIFPESAAQKEDRLDKVADRIVKLTESGILSRESALKEAKANKLVGEDATIGKDPTVIKPKSPTETKK